MPGPKAKPIELSEWVRETLEEPVARHTTGQQKAQRGRIILKAAEGKNNTGVAKELKISVDMVALWRTRWLALPPVGLDAFGVERRLEDFPQPVAASGAVR